MVAGQCRKEGPRFIGPERPVVGCNACGFVATLWPSACPERPPPSPTSGLGAACLCPFPLGQGAAPTLHISSRL